MLKAFLKYLAYRLGYALLQWMPRRALYKIADRAGDFAHAIYPEGRMAVQANLRHVLGQRVPQSYVEGLARSIFRNAARYYADMVSTPRLDIEKFARNDIITHHLANLKDAIATGRGVILASGHYGSPEVTAQFLRVYGIELYVVTEPMAPRALSRFIDGLRSSQGHRFEPVSFEAMKESFRVLRSGGVVALLYDRDVGPLLWARSPGAHGRSRPRGQDRRAHRPGLLSPAAQRSLRRLDPRAPRALLQR
jgi:KDO2-lipid IV(A) lauroyltransferase